MKTVKQRSQKQEKSVAKDFNARPTVASGAKWAMKADVRNDKFLIECKTTEKLSYRITPKVWEKVEEEAIRDRLRIPLLVVDLKDEYRYVIFNPKDFGERIYEPYECTGDVNSDTYLLKHEYLEECSKLFEGEKPILAKLFGIRGKKYTQLVYMHFEDFADFYEEELNND